MVSTYFNIKPVLSHMNTPGATHYDYTFFINRKDKPKLELEHANMIALQNLELLKNNNDVRSIIIYPIAMKQNKTNQIEKILSKYGTTMYKYQINLKSNGVKNLIKEMYRGEAWIGGIFPSDGSTKYSVCIDYTITDNKYPILFYLFKFNDKSKDVTMKKEIRSLYNIENHSIHISDHYVDTFRIAAALLNENSVHFLNNGTNNISAESKGLLTKYFNEVNYNEDYCLTSSIVLELYGLRKAKDIDYLHHSTKDVNIPNILEHKGIWLSYYPCHKHNIIYHPNNYFYFNGHKIASLNMIKEMKAKRNEPKDIKDIQLIEQMK